MQMEKRTRFNIAYLVFALLAILVVQQWWQQAQTVEVVPYSEFEKLLAEGKVGEGGVYDRRRGEPGPARSRRAAVQVRCQLHAGAREHVPARRAVVGGAGAGVLRRV